jgi:tetratricopeptide (TPR) repeat protein
MKELHLIRIGTFALILQTACSSTAENTPRPSTAESLNGQTQSGGASGSSASPPIEEGRVPAADASTAPPQAVAEATTDAAVTPQPGSPTSAVILTDSARAAIQQGLESARQGQLGPARTSFEQALASDARAFQAAYNAGIIAERQGLDSEADTLYQRSLAIQPDYPLALIARSRLLIRQRRLSEAVSFAAGLASSHPESTRVRAEYARLLVLNNRAQDAIEEARRILRQDERNVSAKLAVAEAYRSLGRLDLSLYIVNDLINGSDPNHPNNGPGVNSAEVQHLRGLLQLEVERNVSAAIASFRRAVELDPEYAEARNNLGVQFLLAGNYPEAIEQLRAATALSPSWGKPHLNLGDALRATGAYEQAITELQRALQLEPTLSEVHYNTGRLYSEQARGIAGSDVEGLQRKVQLLQQAQAAFARYRDMLGTQYASNSRRDDVEGQMTRLPQQIERAQRALQRAQAAARRAGAQPTETPPSTPAPAAPAETSTPNTTAAPSQPTSTPATDQSPPSTVSDAGVVPTDA